MVGSSAVFSAYDDIGVPDDSLRAEIDSSDIAVEDAVEEHLEEDNFDPNDWNDLLQSDGWGKIAVRYDGGSEYAVNIAEASVEDIELFVQETDTIASWQISSYIPESERDAMANIVDDLGVSTVCEEAECPNISECWSDQGNGSEATFMLEDSCSRDCSFCAVDSGVEGDSVNSSEVERIVNGISHMDVDHAVVTSVDRDDLLRERNEDSYGIAEALRDIAYRVKDDGKSIEILSPDFQGLKHKIDTVLASNPDVFSHNIETVASLQEEFRDPQAGYDQSLEVLRYAGQTLEELNDDHYTKSSMMLGAGEKVSEVHETIDDLADAGVDILTLGQYKQPSENHWEVREEVPLRRFKALEDYAYRQGFDAVVSHPDSRSSYRAGEVKEVAGSDQEYSMVYSGDQGTALVLRA